MMDNRTGRFETADTMKDLERRIPPEHRGPAFTGGETLSIRGGDFRVVGVEGRNILLRYIGPTKEMKRPRRARGRRPRD